MLIKKSAVLFIMIIQFCNLAAQHDSVHYSVFINPALNPGFLFSFNQRIYIIENDYIKVLNENGKGEYPSFKTTLKKDTLKTDTNEKWIYAYDTTSFLMSRKDELLVIHTLESIKCLDEFMNNMAIIDGLRWFIVCELGEKSLSTFISNVYHDKIAVFPRIINKYVPKGWQLWYANEHPLIKYSGECN